jgi:hypothetical protein
MGRSACSQFAFVSYQLRERMATQLSNITGTSMSTPTTVASAAPEWNPKRLMAVATASSKKLLAPIRLDGPATEWAMPSLRLSRYAKPELKKT